MRFVGDREYNGAAARQIIGWLKAWGWQPTYQPAVGISEENIGIGDKRLREWLDDVYHTHIVASDELAVIANELQRRTEQGTFLSYLINFRIQGTKPTSEIGES